MAKAKLSNEDIGRFPDDPFEGDVHAKHVRSMANATLGVVTSASLGVHAIGRGLANAQGLMPKHAVK